MDGRTRLSAHAGSRVKLVGRTESARLFYDKIELPISMNQKQAQELFP